MAALLFFTANSYAIPVEIVIPGDTVYDLTSDYENKKLDEIVKSITDSNARVEKVSIDREGDDITLTLKVWTDDGKVDIPLKGSKSDFYKLAMGRADGSLIKGMKSATFISCKKVKGAAHYALDYTGFEAAKAKAMESLNAELKAATDAGDISKVEALAKKHKGTPIGGRASATANQMREDKAFEKAEKANTTSAYEEFLEKFPNSMRRMKALAAIKQIKEDAQKAKADAAKAAEQEKREAATAKKRAAEEKAREEIANAYARAKESDSIKAYTDFINKYPKTSQAGSAKMRVAELEDDNLFESSKNSVEGLTGYLSKYPKGRNQARASILLKELKSQSGDLLKVVRIKGTPNLDGDDSDAVWKKSKVLRVPFMAGDGVNVTSPVEVRAVHNGEKIFFLAVWEDKTRDIIYRPWVRKGKRYRPSSQVDDAFSIAFQMDKETKDSCMLNGQNQVLDVWLWRAYWSEISGQGADKVLRVSSQQLPESNAFPAKNGSGQLWVQNQFDAGNPPWRLFVPIASKTTEESVPSYKKGLPSGSAGDIMAAAKWKNGVWTLEMSRALDTGNSNDDVKLAAGRKALCAFAVYDHAEKADHGFTKRITLELEGN